MTETLINIDWLQILQSSSPLLAILCAAVATLIVAAFTEEDDSQLPWIIALVGLSAGFVLAWYLWPKTPAGPILMLSFDRISIVGWIIVIMSAISAAAMSLTYLARHEIRSSDYFALMLLATFGMGILISGSDLISILMGLEIMSVGAYALTGYLTKRASSVEGAMKYFLMGAFATAFFVMGIAFIFGSAGSTDLATISSRAVAVVSTEGRAFFLFGIAMTLVGFGFKVALVPFHAWAPDAYDGAPTPVASFMATGVKAAAFIAFIRFASAAAVHGGLLWHHLVFALAVITMIIGNLAAIRQDNLKRMLAYSSIAHAGYILVVFASISADPSGSMRAIILYLFAYVIMTAGAFAILVAMESEVGEPVDINRLSGLSHRRPFIAAAFTIFMLSLAGFPPTLGFFGKYYLFLAAVKNGDAWLVVVAVLASVISVYFYLRPIMVMYFREEKESQTPAAATPAIVAIIALAALAVIVFGILPQNLVALVQGSAF